MLPIMIARLVWCAMGVVIAAAEEERFTRIKHGKRPVPFSTWQLPFHAIDYCLKRSRHRAGRRRPCRLFVRPERCCSDGHADDATITLPLQPSAQPTGDWLSPWDPLFLSSIVNAPRQLAERRAASPPQALSRRRARRPVPLAFRRAPSGARSERLSRRAVR